MPLTKVECFTVSCDVCGEQFEDDFIPHFSTREEVAEALRDYDWTVWKDEIWCEGCNPACVCGHFFGEHDYGEGPCDDVTCDCWEWRRAG